MRYAPNKPKRGKFMIHHVSISAHDPKHVAGVLAELLNGRSLPFPGRPAGDSWMAVTGDQNGSMIEVYPDTLTLQPGEGEAPVQFVREGRAGYEPFHLLLSV